MAFERLTKILKENNLTIIEESRESSEDYANGIHNGPLNLSGLAEGTLRKMYKETVTLLEDMTRYNAPGAHAFFGFLNEQTRKYTSYVITAIDHVPHQRNK